jgi:CBS domain-containing protein
VGNGTAVLSPFSGSWWGIAGDEQEKAMPHRCVRDLVERDAPVSAASDTTVRVATQAMAEHVCGSILVTEGGSLAGIFTTHDLLTRVTAAGLDPETTSLGDVMTRDPDMLPADASIKTAARRLEELGHRSYLPVVEDGCIIGVLSTSHLLLNGYPRA